MASWELRDLRLGRHWLFSQFLEDLVSKLGRLCGFGSGLALRFHGGGFAGLRSFLTLAFTFLFLRGGGLFR